MICNLLLKFISFFSSLFVLTSGLDTGRLVSYRIVSKPYNAYLGNLNFELRIERLVVLLYCSITYIAHRDFEWERAREYFSNIDIVHVDHIRRDLVERAARHDLVAVTSAERRKEAHFRDCASGMKFVPCALKTSVYCLLGWIVFFFGDFASIASRGYARSGSSTSMLYTWFR